MESPKYCQNGLSADTEKSNFAILRKAISKQWLPYFSLIFFNNKMSHCCFHQQHSLLQIIRSTARWISLFLLQKLIKLQNFLISLNEFPVLLLSPLPILYPCEENDRCDLLLRKSVLTYRFGDGLVFGDTCEWFLEVRNEVMMITMRVGVVSPSNSDLVTRSDHRTSCPYWRSFLTM